MNKYFLDLGKQPLANNYLNTFNSNRIDNFRTVNFAEVIWIPKVVDYYSTSFNNLTDVVKDIEYEYTGVEGTGDDKKTAVIYRTCSLGDPDPADFKAYADLTEADVREFIKKTVNVEDNKRMLNNFLAEQDLPVRVVKDLPWA